jgi:SPOR domain
MDAKDFQRAGVNLEELEQQLLEASRARILRLQQGSNGASPSDIAASLPDMEALRREFFDQGASRGESSSSRPELGPLPTFLDPAQRNPGNEASLFSDAISGAVLFPPLEKEGRSSAWMSRRAWLIFAMMVITALGFFLVYGRSPTGSNKDSNSSVPLIKADAAPVKVKPEAPNDDPAGSGTDLLSKNRNDQNTASLPKIYPEKPVDLQEYAKAHPEPTGAPPLIPGIGQPRLVHTITVRPDGTVLDDQVSEEKEPNKAPVIVPPPPTVVASKDSGTSTQSAVAAASPTTVPKTDSSNSAAKSPTSSASIAGQALPDLMSFPGAVAVDGVPLPASRPSHLGNEGETDDPLKALAEAAAQETVAPQSLAAAPQLAPNLTDGYAVQFGASTAENEANSLAQKLRTQNAALIGDHPIVVVKGDSAGKPVYRVRATGYDKDAAVAACSTATEAGLKCFPAKN